LLIQAISQLITPKQLINGKDTVTVYDFYTVIPTGQRMLTRDAPVSPKFWQVWGDSEHNVSGHFEWTKDKNEVTGVLDICPNGKQWY
jgi:hypothetical protein